uniref:mitogen-activated protein kinase kinase n=1 Tax=Acrobeloides nanus TaxID=290746 RepID=A0A914DS84_9BILA
MELMDVSLHGLLTTCHKSGKNISEDLLGYTAVSILGALNVCKSKGIIHRDIKPENILIKKSGEIKLADFGESRFVGESQKVTTIGAGTIRYWPPERWYTERTRYDIRSDIWSFGLTLAEMAYGKYPIVHADGSDIDFQIVGFITLTNRILEAKADEIINRCKLEDRADVEELKEIELYERFQARNIKRVAKLILQALNEYDFTNDLNLCENNDDFSAENNLYEPAKNTIHHFPPPNTNQDGSTTTVNNNYSTTHPPKISSTLSSSTISSSINNTTTSNYVSTTPSTSIQSYTTVPITPTTQAIDHTATRPTTPKTIFSYDCSDRAKVPTSGVYPIQPNPLDPNNIVNVYCDVGDNNAYTVVQSRGGSSADEFPTKNTLADYTTPFGTPGVDTNFWLGLDNFNYLTSNTGYNYSLQIDLCCGANLVASLHYDNFKVSGSSDGYILNATAEASQSGIDSPGPAGAMTDIGSKFSTYADYQGVYSKQICSVYKYARADNDTNAIGGWWVGSCTNNLNGYFYGVDDPIFYDGYILNNNCQINTVRMALYRTEYGVPTNTTNFCTEPPTNSTPVAQETTTAATTTTPNVCALTNCNGDFCGNSYKGTCTSGAVPWCQCIGNLNPEKNCQQAGCGSGITLMKLQDVSAPFWSPNYNSCLSGSNMAKKPSYASNIDCTWKLDLTDQNLKININPTNLSAAPYFPEGKFSITTPLRTQPYIKLVKKLGVSQMFALRILHEDLDLKLFKFKTAPKIDTRSEEGALGLRASTFASLCPRKTSTDH